MTGIKPKQNIRNPLFKSLEEQKNNILHIKNKIEAIETPSRHVETSRFKKYLKKLTIPWLECGEIIFIITAVSLGFFKFDNYLYFNCIFYASFLSFTSKLLKNLHVAIYDLYFITVYIIDLLRYIFVLLYVFRREISQTKNMDHGFSGWPYYYQYSLIYLSLYLMSTNTFRYYKIYSISSICIITIVLYFFSLISILLLNFVSIIFSIIFASFFASVIIFKYLFNRKYLKEKFNEIQENNGKFNILRFSTLTIHYILFLIVLDKGDFNEMIYN
ncbi:hypothetical protein H312_01643 [Anncaliia algerae PRA339]|uniref:Uncharacterized protein n=1 Tax=Anncaliia algerae PRA339 TaxID=1288291 RepID=A0A059F183_9MICR|nr:hypothetical protein H312_01643 [Anncaliia algerae PRA339]